MPPVHSVGSQLRDGRRQCGMGREGSGPHPQGWRLTLKNRREFSAFACVVAALLAALPWPVRAQAVAQSPPGEERGAGSIPVQTGGFRGTGASPTPESASALGVVPPVPIEEALDPTSYVCGRGDIFELNFWGRQNFRHRVTVDSEGRAFIPKMGYIKVAGRSLAQARAELKQAVARYFPGLSFDLSLLEPRTFLVHVVDGVRHPGLFPVRATERASVALEKAGGLLENASRRRITIDRKDGQRVAVDVLRYQLKGDKRSNPFLMDGDLIRVPFEEVTVDISGAVNRPGHFELTGSKNLAEAVDLAGGFSVSVTRKLPIRIVRKGADDRAALIQVPFGGDESVPSVAVEASDTIYVPNVSDLQQTVLLIGAVAGSVATDEATSLRRLPFVEHDTVRSLLERAGGVNASADLKGSYIIRENGERVAVDLEGLLVLRDFSRDLPVHIGDAIVVPYKRRSVIVEGAVSRPNAYPFNPQFSVLDYVSIAGGKTRFAQGIETIRLVSPSGKTVEFSPAMQVGPGDTIMVPEREFTRGEIVQLILAGAGLLVSSIAVFVALKR